MKGNSMKLVPAIIFLMLLFGCDNTAEQAANNLKKGDEYFATKQYEVAEYYYDKIPEESPLYKEAQLKVEKIDDIQKGALPKISAAEESQKVSVFDQTMTSNAGGTHPIHSVELNNESVYKIVSVTLEFTYLDGTGNVVGVKQFKVATLMNGKTQDTFKGISPGDLESPCTSCKVKVVSAEFQ
jgi:hypothetical protein